MTETVDTTIQHVASQHDPQSPKAKAPRVLKAVTKKEPVNQRVPLAKGEKRQRKLEVVEPKKVRATFTFKTTQSSTDEYPVVSLFDFSSCSDDEILIMAASSVRIMVQHRLREMGDEAARSADALAVVDVKGHLLNAKRGENVEQMVWDIRSIARRLRVSEDKAREILAANVNV